MKSYFRGRQAAIALCCLCLAATVSAEPIELLPNGGGEKIDAKMLPAYFGVQNAGEIRSIPDARTGDRAVRLLARPHEWNFSVFGTPNPGSYPQDDVLKIQVVKGGLYRASAWVRGNGIFRLGVQRWPSTLGSQLSEPVVLTADWQRVDLTFRADAPDITATNLQFRLDGDQAVADVDDVSFTFDQAENPGIEHFGRIPQRNLRVLVETRQTRLVELYADGKPIGLESGRGVVPIREGLVAVSVRAVPSGVHAGVRLRIQGHPEIDGRWRGFAGGEDGWQTVAFDDRKWPIVATDKDGYMWPADWRGFSPRGGPDEVCFRQVLLWNETHHGPNRCILPQAREWGFSRGSMENLTLALYSPLPYGLSDYEFILDVPEGFSLFGKAGDYYSRHVLNQRPTHIVEQAIVKEGTRFRRYRFAHPERHVGGDTNHPTQYSLLPLRLRADYSAETTAFHFRRQAKGNFTELEQRLPVRILPPVNGRQPRQFMISAYVGMPTGYSALSPEHLAAFVEQMAATGWTHVSVAVPGKGCAGWGPEWLGYQQRYLELCKANGIRGILWPPYSFPITGAVVENMVSNDLLDWVESTSGARARYFMDTPKWDRARAHMYCPSFVTAEGAATFREIVKREWAGMTEQMGGTDIIWTDDERFIFSADGRESYCFCDRCKSRFREFAKLPADANLSDENIFKTYNRQWRLFWAHAWFGGVHAELKKAANDLGKRYMLYSWNGSDDLWRAARGNFDIAFPGMPGSNVMNAAAQKNADGSMAFYRKEGGVQRVQGQSFAVMKNGHRKNAWATQQVISRDGYVDAKSWKSQLLRLAATLQGGVDLGESAIDHTAGSCYWIGEATRIIAAHEDLFFDGVRSDALACSKEISYPNLLVLKQGDERLVLLFNEGENDLPVTLENLGVKPGQRARIGEQEAWVDAAMLRIVVPARDAVAVHVR